MVLANWKVAPGLSHVAVSVRFLSVHTASRSLTWRISDLHTRKEVRETAWKLEGWSDTVSKVRGICVTVLDSPMECSPNSLLDCAILEVHGFVYPGTLALQPIEINDASGKVATFFPFEELGLTAGLRYVDCGAYPLISSCIIAKVYIHSFIGSDA